MSLSLSLYNPHPHPQYNDVMQVGIPFSPGQWALEDGMALFDENGQRIPCQPRVLGHWPDGTVRWAMVRWPGALEANQSTNYTLSLSENQQDDGDHTEAPCSEPSMDIAGISDTGDIYLDTGVLKLGLSHCPATWITQISIPGTINKDWVTWDPSVKDGQLFATVNGQELILRFTQPVDVLNNGPVVAELYYHGVCEDSAGNDVLRFRLRVIASRGSQQLRVSLTFHNPRHQPREELGHFRLGLPNAALIDDAGLRLALRGEGVPWVLLAGDDGKPDFLGPIQRQAILHQDSSGNENWFHRSHINREWKFPQQFRGYNMSIDGTEAYTGDHAGGWAAIADQRNCIAIGVEKFWQNFPQVLRCERHNGNAFITAALFPKEAKFRQELVGGEQKTHHLVLSFTRIDKPVWSPHAVCPHPAPQIGYASLTQKMRALLERPIYLPPVQQFINAGVSQPTEAYSIDCFGPYERAVDCLFEDPEFTLFDLRDKWDHYGWRNFGDFNADYEGGGNLLSHHNNEYDFSRGLMLQAIRRHEANPVSARKFIEAGLWAAIHQSDIDTYHTTEDPHGGYCYNGGKFTHTAHLIEPGRGGHRQSDSAQFYGDLDWPWGRGGGPESGHYDNEGIMLAHYLTGDPVLAETAIEIADNVAHKIRTHNFPQHDYYRTSGHNMACCLIGYFHSWDETYVETIETILRETTPDKVQTDRKRDSDGLFSAGSYFNGNYLKPVLMYIDVFRRLFSRTPEQAWQNLQRYCDCMHRYNYHEEKGLFATVPAADPTKQSFPLAEGGGATWFHVDAFCWAAMLRPDESQRDAELIRAFRHYIQICDTFCPQGHPVYHNNKVFTYTVNNGHSVLRAITQFPELFAQAKQRQQSGK